MTTNDKKLAFGLVTLMLVGWLIFSRLGTGGQLRYLRILNESSIPISVRVEGVLLPPVSPGESLLTDSLDPPERFFRGSEFPYEVIPAGGRDPLARVLDDSALDLADDGRFVTLRIDVTP